MKQVVNQQIDRFEEHANRARDGIVDQLNGCIETAAGELASITGDNVVVVPRAPTEKVTVKQENTQDELSEMSTSEAEAETVLTNGGLPAKQKGKNKSSSRRSMRTYKSNPRAGVTSPPAKW